MTFITVHRRQTMLFHRHAAKRVDSLTATGRQAFLPPSGHTHFANAPGFWDEVPASPLRYCAQLPMGFGRIARSVKPYSPSLPLVPSSATVPPVRVRKETPRLDCRYCAPKRHCLSITTSLPAFRRFPRLDVPEQFGYSSCASSTTNHGFTPMALRNSTTPPRWGRLQV